MSLWRSYNVLHNGVYLLVSASITTAFVAKKFVFVSGSTKTIIVSVAEGQKYIRVDKSQILSTFYHQFLVLIFHHSSSGIHHVGSLVGWLLSRAGCLVSYVLLVSSSIVGGCFLFQRLV